jgi:hypothetical protein
MKQRIRKIANLFKQRNFLGALALALALWLYITLNSEFVANIYLPLIVKLPPTRAIENPLPDKISVKVKGTGWQIFNLNYFNSAAKCEIDLSNERIKDSIHILSKSEISKNLQSLVNVDAIDLTPSTLYLNTGEIADYSIVVVPDAIIEPADGYLLVGKPIVKPDLINISGNDKILRNITEWRTSPLRLEGISEPVFIIVPLVDSLSNIVTLSQNKAKIIADIQKMSEIVLEDIPVEITGSDITKNHFVTPLRVSLTIRGGIEDIISLDRRSISVTISASEVESDSIGYLKPRVELPQNIRLLSINPPYLKHRIRVQ